MSLARRVRSPKSNSVCTIAVLLCATMGGHLLAQSPSVAPLPSACVPAAEASTFKGKTAPSSPLSPPANGMAQIVFIDDQLNLHPPRVTSCIGGCAVAMRLSMDGQWLADTKDLSYAVISINPGDHHFCAMLPQRKKSKLSPIFSLYGLHADAGKTYFLRGRLMDNGLAGLTFDLTQINEDEGRYLVSTTPQSLSTAAK